MIDPGAPRRSTWWAFFAMLLIALLAWTGATPLMSAPDEGAHAIWAASVARGQISGPSKQLILENWVVRVPKNFADSGQADCFNRFPFANQNGPPQSRTPSCAPRFEDSDRLVDALTYQFRGVPHQYALLGLPSLPFPNRTGMYLMRAINAMACSALLASACTAAVHRPRRRLAIVGVLAASTPMVFYLGGTINPNGIEIAAAIALWSTLIPLALNDSSEPDHRLVVRAGLALSVLVAIRGLGPGFALLAIAVCAVLASRERLLDLIRRRDVRVWAIVAALSTAITAAWILRVGVANEDPYRTVGLVRALEFLPKMWRQTVGLFGATYMPLPRVVPIGWGAIVAVAIVLALVVVKGRQRFVLAITTLGAIALPVMADGFGLPRIGFEWQGRYGLPLTVGAVMLAFALPETRRRISPWAGAIPCGLLLTGQVVAFLAIGRTLGMGGAHGANILDYIIRPRWQPDVDSGVLLILMVLAVLGLAALIIPMLARPPNSELEHPGLASS